MSNPNQVLIISLRRVLHDICGVIYARFAFCTSQYMYEEDTIFTSRIDFSKCTHPSERHAYVYSFTLLLHFDPFSLLFFFHLSSFCLVVMTEVLSCGVGG